MAIRNRNKISAARASFGRGEPRDAFYRKLDRLIDDNQSAILNFYGGAGKSALLNSLIDDFSARSEQFSNVVCLYHDFKRGIDRREILDRWADELERRGCTFPTFRNAEEALPELFARDFSDWAGDSKRLLIFLDSYELLGNPYRLSKSSLPSDWWFREQLLYNLPPTLCVIAGRTGLRCTGSTTLERYRLGNDNAELREETDRHFEQLLNSLGDISKATLYLKSWASLTARLTGDPDELEGRYNTLFRDSVRQLIAHGKFKAAEDIVEAFRTCRAAQFNSQLHALFDREMGIVKSEQGEFREALDCNRAAYETYSTELGEPHPDTILAMERLIVNLLELGQFDEAFQFKTRLLNLHDQIAKLDPNVMLESMNNLASALRQFGCYNEALEILHRMLNIFEDNVGKDHPASIATLENIADTLESKIILEESEELVQATKNGVELPPDVCHVDDRNEVLQLKNEVLTRRLRVLGERHPDTISAMENVAATLQDMQNFGYALELIKHAFELRREILGEDHVKTLQTMLELVSALRQMRRLDAALEFGRQCVSINAKVFGSAHPNTLAAMEELSCVLNDMHRFDEAAELRFKLPALRQQLAGEETLDMSIAMLELSETLAMLGREEEADALLDRASQLDWINN